MSIVDIVYVVVVAIIINSVINTGIYFQLLLWGLLLGLFSLCVHVHVSANVSIIFSVSNILMEQRPADRILLLFLLLYQPYNIKFIAIIAIAMIKPLGLLLHHHRYIVIVNGWLF